jgi:methionine-rich copper-binding protein CopC
VGWTIENSPPKLTIWFDGELEPGFSSIAVYNGARQQVDKKNSRVGGSDNSVLEVELPVLPPGSYRVSWRALSKDTHVTEGDFTFTIAGKSN